ncbi:MAG TPA: hypothetical protein VD689_04850 [Nitrosopumilaceae archaeon]|nr:hypothetical protein [Nitrosopumilaceae archaeon]
MVSIKSTKITNSRKKIQKLSSLVEKRLEELDSDKKKINQLSLEELQDFNQILRIADYILYKYEHKKEVFSLIKEFVDMVSSSVGSMDDLNDNISELVISAEDSIKRIKSLQSNVSENFTLEPHAKSDGFAKSEGQDSTNNLTKSATPVYL